MKILQINNYNYLKGGSEKVYQETINILKSNGHEVRYFSTYDSQNEYLCDGVSVKINKWSDYRGVFGKIIAFKNFIYNKTVALNLEELLKDFKPDVAHLHIYYGTLSNSVIGVLKKYNIPIVQSVHEYRILCPAYTFLNSRGEICEKCSGKRIKYDCVKYKCTKNSKMFSLLASFENLVRDVFFNPVKSIDAFIMVSRFIQNKHTHYFPEIESKTHHIYNSVDIDYYNKFLSVPEEKDNYYLYFGRLSHEKGLGNLIRVFEENPNIKLKVAGTGPIEDFLKKHVNQAKINNVEFLGFISGEKLYHLISKAKFTIVPSEWYENNPLSVIESLVLGTPVIGAKIGGIPELVDNGKNGYLHISGNYNSLNEAIINSSTLSFSSYSDMCNYSKKIADEMYNFKVYYSKIIKVYNIVRK